MATLEEALAAATVDDASDNNVLMIDNDLRTIAIPGGTLILGVESDEDVHRIYFKIPSTYGEFDLSTFVIRVNYQNGSNPGDAYLVEDAVVEGEYIRFSWLVGRSAFTSKGTTTFSVCLKLYDADGTGTVKKEFNTTTAVGTVLQGLETSAAVISANSDLIDQILAKLQNLTEISQEDIVAAVAEYMEENPIEIQRSCRSGSWWKTRRCQNRSRHRRNALQLWKRSRNGRMQQWKRLSYQACRGEVKRHGGVFSISYPSGETELWARPGASAERRERHLNGAGQAGTGRVGEKNMEIRARPERVLFLCSRVL